MDLGLVSKIDPGIMKAEYGEASYQYIIRGLQLVFLGEVSALVT